MSHVGFDPAGERLRHLTPTQVAWLLDLLAGRDPWANIHGRSAHGGATGTTHSLRRRGWLDEHGKLSEAGTARARLLVATRKRGGR